jgi:two-component system phosphate regulon response regulator PhoB
MRQPIALVIDDEDDIRSLISFMLERAGFVVHEESDGEAGLVAARTVRPDIVLVDWMMPRLSGIDLCRALRLDESQRSTIVVLLSAKARDEDVALGIAAGAQDYISKPFHPKEMVARVAALLEGSPRAALL